MNNNPKMKNLIKSKFLDSKRLGSGRGLSMSSNEDGSNNLVQPVQQQQRPSKKYLRQQQQGHQQRDESRSDSKSPLYRHQNPHQQSPRDSGVRDLFRLPSSQQPPQMPIQQPRQAVFRTTDTSCAHEQQSSGYTNNDDDRFDQQLNKQRLITYQQQPQSTQLHSRADSTRRQYSNSFVPSPHEQDHRHHYQRGCEPVGLALSTSPISFSGPAASPENNHVRSKQQQQTKFEFGCNSDNVFAPDNDRYRVRFLSPSSSVSSSFSEEPSQVHMMAGGGHSVASSSCMSLNSSYQFESGKKNRKGELAIFDKVVRGAMHEENERLCAMGMMSIHQDGTTSSRTSGRSSSERQWTSPTPLPRMGNEQFEVNGIESEYHDIDDEELYSYCAFPLSLSSGRASAATNVSTAASTRELRSDDRTGNQKRSEEDNFAISSFIQWSSSHFR